jgi:periplasmic protein TonB
MSLDADCLTLKLVAMNSSKKTDQKGMKPTTLLQLGMIVSLGVTLVGFEFANVDIKRDKVTTAKMEAVEMETVIDYEIEKPKVPNQNQQQEQQPNNQNTSTVQQITTNIQTTQNQQLVTTNVGNFTGDTTIIIKDITGPNTIITNEVFDIVEDMPTYTDLLSIKDKGKRKSATEKELLTNIYKTIKYPEMARQIGAQGKVYVSFIVNTEGEITNVKITRGVNDELDAEALRAVNSLPKMVPGKQLDKPVNVRYNIPIEYRLNR